MQNNTGIISVIIPVYNSERYLSSCIDTVRNQSYSNLEIILVNDGSTDRSGEICAEYATRDSRIQVIHTENRGVSAARNSGIGKASGSYIFFADADDTLSPVTLEHLASVMGNGQEYDWVIGDFKLLKDKVNLREKDFFYPDDRSFSGENISSAVTAYLQKPRGASEFTNIWGKLFKTSLIRQNNLRFREDLQTWEDLVFNFEYLQHTASFYYLHEQLYHYHVHSGVASAGSKIFNHPLGFHLVLECAADFLRFRGFDEKNIKDQCRHAAVYFAVRLLYLTFILWQRRKSPAEINAARMRLLIHQLITDPEVQAGARNYRGSANESRLLPFLIKWKLNLLIFLVCRHKARKLLKREALHEKAS